ncbi:Hypothetical protein PHPALM_8285 [Phytophthora palmivora]|uniref:TKL protein kinase n=1 Tax=Phytophthora palmivora TaxID=4796 RepID=A0A2P4YA73_9STRA|nr:Hypothetical protein PHPALM_8285 [Phytophthora palmivora]
MPSLRIVAVVWAALVCSCVTAQTSCASRVSVGDQGVGISAIEDASCRNGGVGCFPDGNCRYCQTFASPQSNHLIKCSSWTTQPTSNPSPQRTATPTIVTPISTASDCTAIVKRSSLTGISFVTDNTCNVARPTVMGCTAFTNCRLCRTSKNENNQFLVNCASLQNAGRRLSSGDTMNDNGGPPKHIKNITGIALGCVGGMALVVAIIGVAHSKLCRRDNTQ